MKDIEKLSDMIEEEIADAEKYIHCAILEKESHPYRAEVFYKLSTEELQHMNMLHELVVKAIDEYRKQVGDPPVDMQARYDYMHKRHIEKTIYVKNLQLIYKSST